MKKYIMTSTKLFSAMLIAISSFACQGNFKSINGSGNVTTETRNLGDFTKVEANKGIDVVIEQSETASVIVQADDNVQKHILTTVENGVLVITSDYNNYRNVTKKVTVKMPVINGLHSTSGVSMKSSGVLKSDDLTLEASSGSQMELNVESDKIQAESSSGSHISLRGKALSLTTAASSGSEVDADELLANDVTSQASSGSSTGVHAIVKLDAHASSGSSIRYNGVPKSITKEESSGGSVSGR
jgi:hypothetical protein